MGRPACEWLKPRNWKLLWGACLSLSCAGSAQPSPTVVPPPPRVTKPVVSAEPRELVLVPGGVLALGGAESGSVATFEIGRTEVTVAAYRKCVEAGSCPVPGPYFEDGGPLWPECRAKVELECNYQRSDREDHPINCVTVKQAESYCAWRGQRLPTSAEWELAARGPEGRGFPWGNAPWVPERANLCDRQCVRAFACPFGPASTKLDDGFASTAPIASYPAGKTPSGIFDLLGNVSEFTSSVGRGDGIQVGWSGSIARGESWTLPADFMFRDQLSERYASPSVGFRCARDVRSGEK